MAGAVQFMCAGTAWKAPWGVEVADQRRAGAGSVQISVAARAPPVSHAQQPLHKRNEDNLT